MTSERAPLAAGTELAEAERDTFDARIWKSEVVAAKCRRDSGFAVWAVRSLKSRAAADKDIANSAASHS